VRTTQLDLHFQFLLSRNLDSITRWVLFSSHMEGSTLEREVFNEAALMQNFMSLMNEIIPPYVRCCLISLA
jgi:hypothetical protein